MKGLKLKMTFFASVTMIAISIIFKEAISLLTEYNFSDRMFFPVRMLELLGLDLLIFSAGAFLIGRKKDEVTFPGKLKEKTMAKVFFTVGALLASVDALRDSILQANSNTAPASLAVPGVFFLWIGVGSLMSLAEVEGEAKTYRIVRSVLSLTVSVGCAAVYALNWISAIASA